MAPPADTMLTTLEDAYGGRVAITDQLSTLTDPRAAKVVALLADPQWSGKSLGDLCRACEVSASTLLVLLREGAISRAVAQAHLRLQTRLPKVVDRIADAAEGGLVPCGCTVGGQQDAIPGCPMCRGTGQSYNKPSLPHQELVLDVLGVTPKAGPSVQTNVNVQQNVSLNAGIFDAFVKGSRSPQPAATRPVIDTTAVKD